MAVGRRSIKRRQLPEDLIGAIVFAASDESDFMTGQTIVVDGGVVSLKGQVRVTEFRSPLVILLPISRQPHVLLLTCAFGAHLFWNHMIPFPLPNSTRGMGRKNTILT
jgi:hypothetical protein